MPYRPYEDVLYFPSIEIGSVSWLKASLLVWDHVYRIVPVGYTPKDRSSVKEAIDAGLIRDLRLEEKDKNIAASHFKDLIANAPVTPDGFSEGDGARLHVTKVNYLLAKILADSEVTMRGDWYEMPRAMARGYMLMLSRTVAGRRSLALATDRAEAWTASAYLETDGNVDKYLSSPDAPDRYCYLQINDVLPIKTADMSIRAIAEFGRNHAEEKRLLREEIANTASRLAMCDSSAHSSQIVRDLTDSLEQRTKAYRRGFPVSVAKDSFFGLTTGLTTALGVTEIGALGVANPIVLGAAAIVGFVCSLADSLKAHETRKRDLIASYLVNAPTGSVKQTLPEFPSLMEEFVND